MLAAVALFQPELKSGKSRAASRGPAFPLDGWGSTRHSASRPVRHPVSVGSDMVNVHRSTGGCLCGAVLFRIAGPLRPVLFCHCGQCRKWHGHVGAYTSARRKDIDLDGEDRLGWFESSPGIRRGFCRSCGSSLFWDALSRDQVSISAGAFDAPSGLEPGAHVYTADAGDYYEIADRLPRRNGPAGI